jgi:hypothetical protein
MREPTLKTKFEVSHLPLFPKRCSVASSIAWANALPPSSLSNPQDTRITLGDGEPEHAAVAQLANHTLPTDRRVLVASSAMKNFMADLALQPKLLDQYKADPRGVVGTVEGLTTTEQEALSRGSAGAIDATMARRASDIDAGQGLASPLLFCLV